MAKKKTDEKVTDPGKPEYDDQGNRLYPAADVDGDGDLESIPYPGPHTQPTVPADAPKDGDKVDDAAK